MDIVQSRYGYSDEHVLTMPFAIFLQKAKLAIQQSQQENEEAWRRQALVAWSIQNLFAGENAVSFSEYLSGMKLGYNDYSNDLEFETTEEVLNYIDNLFSDNVQENDVQN